MSTPSSYESATPKTYSLFEKFVIWYIKNPIVIYTMGKVGSSSLVNSIREMGFLEIQPHSLSFSRKGSYFVVPELTVAQSLYSWFKTLLIQVKSRFFLLSKIGREIKIITLVRDPLPRNISAFFEQLSYVVNDDVSSLDLHELQTAYDKYANHMAPVEWFDREIKWLFNIDVYDYPFDKDKGYSIVRKGSVSILVLRLDKLSSLEPIIADFLGVDTFQIKSTNRGSKKRYADQYRNFKENANFSKDYVLSLYQSKFAKFFYTPVELTEMQQRWL